ncbi:hypothetical protein HPP92_011832 [Vanilla planifolia]|uniref:RRM domain-containing protein n=1 Tax=Vanilla planifolia TaxID=51239 RepID=A0A835R2K3_VANPL|nr:hypothetical protein HPP92_011832 [Vanilla planifolia]
MALSCAYLFAPVDIRRCSPRPPRHVFFHHGHLIERRRVSLSRTGYLTVSASRIRNAQAGIHPSSTEEKDPPSARIFIKGLSHSTSEGYLSKLFSQFGEVSKVKIITTRGSRESLGFGYIWFVYEESANLAVKEMNGKFVDGRFIAVMMSRPEAPTKHIKFMPYKF